MPVKNKISQNFVAFSEYMNFNILDFIYRCAFCRFVFLYIFDDFYLVKLEIVWYIFQDNISWSLLQRQQWIVIYYVKKFVK